MIALPFFSPFIYYALHLLSQKRIEENARFKYRILVQLCIGSWLIVSTGLICWMVYQEVFSLAVLFYVALVSALCNGAYLFYSLSQELTPSISSEEKKDLRMILSLNLDHLIKTGIIQEKNEGVILSKTSLRILAWAVLFLRGNENPSQPN